MKDTDEKRKKILIVIICFIVVGLLSTFLLVMKNTGDDSGIEEIATTNVLKEMSYSTLKVVDYEKMLDSGNYVEWEVRYSPIKNVSILYKNNNEQKDTYVATSIQETVDFQPEKLNVTNSYDKKIEGNDTGILYQTSLKESEEYVAFLISRGYKIRRKILTPNYAEIYLYDDSNNTIRVLIFDKIMLKSVLDSNELPEIDSYFNIKH